MPRKKQTMKTNLDAQTKLAWESRWKGWPLKFRGDLAFIGGIGGGLGYMRNLYNSSDPNCKY